MSSLQPPVLSRFDPAVTAEGNIDPLGTAAAYTYLAERVLPHLTLRMSRPRYLTMVAVGARVAQGFEEDLAADEKTPAWLVFEWLVAEAFLRNEEALGDEALGGFPGRRKVRAAVQQGHRLSAYTYLKGARVLGYTGVQRRLAEALRIVDEHTQLDDGGIELVRAWEQDQGLDGFYGGTRGDGASLREDWRQALRRSMDAGATVMPRKWTHWKTLTAHLRPDGAGERERKVTAARLVRTDLQQNPHDPQATEMRRELFGHLKARSKLLAASGEPAFFEAIRPEASEALRMRLDLIDAYEALCQPIESAFLYALHASTRKGPGPVGIDELAAGELGQAMAARIEPALDRLAAVATEPAVNLRVRPLLERYAGVRDAAALFETVLSQHEENQRRKPPDGRRPWFERLDGCPVVRQRYAQHEAPPTRGYVHDYRCRIALRFLRDLGEVSE